MAWDGGHQLDLLQKTRAPARYEQTEHELQIDCTTMLWQTVLPDVAWTAIDHAHSLNMKIGRHGAPIGILEANKRIARGIRPGIPDFIFVRQGQAFALELKTVNGVLSDDQKLWLREFIRAGGEVSVCFSFDQFVAKVIEWGLCRGCRVTA